MDYIVSQSKATFLPRRDLVSLTVNCKYHILDINFVNTKFGQSVVVDLEDTGSVSTDKKFFVYLPKRWHSRKNGALNHKTYGSLIIYI